jgi:hypothetical protein
LAITDPFPGYEERVFYDRFKTILNYFASLYLSNAKGKEILLCRHLFTFDV